MDRGHQGSSSRGHFSQGHAWCGSYSEGVNVSPLQVQPLLQQNCHRTSNLIIKGWIKDDVNCKQQMYWLEKMNVENCESHSVTHLLAFCFHIMVTEWFYHELHKEESTSHKSRVWSGWMHESACTNIYRISLLLKLLYVIHIVPPGSNEKKLEIFKPYKKVTWKCISTLLQPS